MEKSVDEALFFFRNGDSVVTQLADMMQAAVDRAASQGKAQSGAALRMVPWSPASAVTTNKTYLKGLIIVRGEDFNSDTDPLELRWQAKQRRRSDNFVMLSQNTNMNMPNHISQLMELPLINAVQNSAGYIWLKLLEDDGSWGVDHYGEYTLQTESPNYLFKSWIEPYFGGGGDRCGAVTSEGNFSCPYPTSYGYYFWKEVNFNLQWQPWSPPPVALEISGPGSINPTEEVTWELQNITGSGTLSYDWWLDGTLVGSGPTFTTTIADPASTHWLSVDVYNGTGYWEHADMGILVNSGSCDPDDPDCLESLRIWPQ